MKVIRNTALICLLLTIAMIAVAYLTWKGDLDLAFEQNVEELNALEQLEYYAVKDADDYTLCLVAPKGLKEEDVSVDFDYVTRMLTIDIAGIDESYFYENHLMGGTEFLEKISYRGNAESAGFRLQYSKVFEFSKEIRDGYLYVRAKEPRDCYDYIVVIDAGHGGDSSPGTVWDDVRESTIDLAIASKLWQLLLDSDYNIGVYMTRVTDRDVPLSRRVELANILQADAFISIHNNTNGLKRMDDTVGTEVLYNEIDASGESLAFAKLVSKELVKALDSKDRGVVAGSEKVQILRESEVPVALAEVGFMSNARELAKLQDGNYQQAAAQGLYKAIIKEICEE